MKLFTKTATAVGLAAALALTAATPSLARDGRWAAAGAGFVAGTFLGAAIANSNARYYNDSYAYSPYYDGYAYGPGPTYYRSYNTVPAYETYGYEPAPRYRFRNNGSTREDQLTGTGIN